MQSEKGWMTSQIFNEYFARFCGIVKERPLLLIFDGHLTHLDPITINTAIKENIIIIKLPSHTTDLLQPLDKCCFRPLKLEWDKKLIRWQMENQHKLSKSEFADLLCETWHDGFKPATIISGFVSTGIYPVNRLKYPVSRFDPTKLQRYYQETANEHTAHFTNLDNTHEQDDDNNDIQVETESLNERSSNNTPRTTQEEASQSLPSTSQGTNLITRTSETKSNLGDKNFETMSGSSGCSFESILLNKLKKPVHRLLPAEK